MTTSEDASCELCSGPGGETVWQDALCRVVLVGDDDYPGYCRVVWNAHVAEMSDLTAAERRHLMGVVCAVEAALRSLMRPDKINLASFGNLVPHLHWHVIARFRADRHYPLPIWAAPQRAAGMCGAPLDRVALTQAIVQALAEDHAGGI